MNKKFMVVALMAALSSVGYAYDPVGSTEQNITGTVTSWGDRTFEGKVNLPDVNKINQKFEALEGQVTQNKIDFDYAKADLELKDKEHDKAIADLTNNKADKSEVTGLTDRVNEIKKDFDYAKAESELKDKEHDKAIEDLTDNKADKTQVENLTGRVDEIKKDFDYAKAESELKDKEHDKAIEDLTNNKVDKNTYEEDKKAQADIDASQQSEIAGLAGQIGNLGNTIIQNKEDQAAIDKSQNDTIDGLNQQIGDLANNKADKAEVEDLKDQVEKNEQAIQGNTQQIEDLHKEDANLQEQISNNQQAIQGNTQQIEDLHKKDAALQEQIDTNKKEQAATDKKQDDRITTNEKDIAQNKQDIADLQNQFAGYDGRLSGLEKKVDHLDDKMNKGLSLMAAMNAVDFQNVQTGEMALGAGIGHYGNAQSVALGVAYAPVEDLTVNAKYSITAGDADSFAVGAGATYKFKVGR